MMIKQLIENIKLRYREWKAKPKYDYVETILDSIEGCVASINSDNRNNHSV